MNVISSGTQSATVTTKHSLHATTTAATYVLMVDCSAMVIGDFLDLSIDVAYDSGGTLRQTYSVTYAHGQSDPGKVSVPVVAPYGAEFFLKQTAGTSRSFPWALVAL